MENETADEDTFSPEDTDPDFLVLYMNLQDPLVNLRKIIEKRLNLNAGHLQEFEFYLQDNQLVRMIYFCVETQKFPRITVYSFTSGCHLPFLFRSWIPTKI